MVNVEVTSEQLKNFIKAIQLKEIELAALKSVAKDLYKELSEARSGGMNLWEWLEIPYEDCVKYLDE